MILLFVQLNFILHHTHIKFVILLFFWNIIVQPNSDFGLSTNCNCHYITELGMLVTSNHFCTAYKLASDLDAI